MKWTLNPHLCPATSGWSAVFMPYSELEPDRANFYPVIAWGTVNVNYGKDGGGVGVEPVAIVLSDVGTIEAVSPDGGHGFIGYCQPGEREDEYWTKAARDMWRGWRAELSTKAGE